MQVSDYKVDFTLMHLVFLELDIYHFHLYLIPTATVFSLEKTNWNWSIFAWWNWTLWKVAKKINWFSTIAGLIDTCLITLTVITGGVSIARVGNGVGIPVVIALKQEKHNRINLFAQSKLDIIADIISQTMQDGDISSTEFH